MNKHTVYTLLDENGKILWVGTTPYPIKTRIEQHRMLPMNFASYEVDRVYKTQKKALQRVDQLHKQHGRQIGGLPPYLLEMLV